MNNFYFVSNIGELYVPAACREAVFARGRVKRFAPQELAHLGRIFTHVQRGGVAVVEGQWAKITAVMDYIQRHKRELVSPDTARIGKGQARAQRHASKQADEAALSRLMCWADKTGELQVEPPLALPYLLELIGEPPDANEAYPFLVPVMSIQRICRALEATYPIDALGASLVASENVLAPRSQETIECFQEALQYVRRFGPSAVADIGCGSGCLTLLARQELGEEAALYASDLLPEAGATTKLNIQRVFPNAPRNIQVMPAGDLFEPFPPQQFDLIIFNAPWVVARARNRAELAIHDEKQQTLKRFFEHASNFLKPEGAILLGYADASGPKAIATLETTIASAGFVGKNLFKRRVATHRSKRKWEQIRVYVLGRG